MAWCPSVDSGTAGGPARRGRGRGGRYRGRGWGRRRGRGWGRRSGRWGRWGRWGRNPTPGLPEPGRGFGDRIVATAAERPAPEEPPGGQPRAPPGPVRPDRGFGIPRTGGHEPAQTAHQRRENCPVGVDPEQQESRRRAFENAPRRPHPGPAARRTSRGGSFGATASPVRSFGATGSLVRLFGSTASPVRGFDSTASPVRGFDSTASPVRGLDSTASPVRGFDSTASPVRGSGSRDGCSPRGATRPPARARCGIRIRGISTGPLRSPGERSAPGPRPAATAPGDTALAAVASPAPSPRLLRRGGSPRRPDGPGRARRPLPAAGGRRAPSGIPLAIPDPSPSGSRVTSGAAAPAGGAGPTTERPLWPVGHASGAASGRDPAATDSDREPPAPPTTAAGQHPTPSGRFHPGAKPVLPLSPPSVRLKCSLHETGRSNPMKNDGSAIRGQDSDGLGARTRGKRNRLSGLWRIGQEHRGSGAVSQRRHGFRVVETSQGPSPEIAVNRWYARKRADFGAADPIRCRNMNLG